MNQAEPQTSPINVGAGFALAPDDPVLAKNMTDGLAIVEDRLRAAVAQTDDIADASSKHLIDAGGKRVRPLLVLLAAQLGDSRHHEVVEAAVVTELTHLATLYHDDVMDSAPMRRGAPSAHEVWGNSIAILTGDLLFARASSIVAELGPEAVSLQAKTFERLCLGQMRETLGPDDGADRIEHYIGVLSDKTGSLISAAGQFGTRFSGAPAAYVPVLAEFGEKIGVAFQLADDVIDLTIDAATSGKTPGTDLRERVPTLPVLLARKAADDGDAASRDLVALLDADLSTDEALAGAVAAMRAHPAVAEASAEARKWADAAIAALAPLPDGSVKDALSAFARTVVERTA
ncbi:polyprenyl synthetase family protein [Spelaeicoccus albus]|uniref:Heptaprenyl diphosphate synthase n=1 Tax=Spelaeicoccus albus TaxID=1280376 RepID=A0A7Z0D5S0_9MICO|nr:polyprenyl synthetase family protein [Spelaeicoccus albus]NYI69368.1 heptaprenyl diphosphate synthase [Spelaeicoccus albus]